MTPLLSHFRAIWGVYETGAGSRRANEILRLASAYFAKAELDRRAK